MRNGDLPEGISGRSLAGRLWRDAFAALVADLDGTALSEGDKLVLRAVAGLVVQAELLMARIAAGEMLDEALTANVTAQREALEGLRRRHRLRTVRESRQGGAC